MINRHLRVSILYITTYFMYVKVFITVLIQCLVIYLQKKLDSERCFFIYMYIYNYTNLNVLHVFSCMSVSVFL